VQNIIEARLPPPPLPLLEGLDAGVTLVVEAGWEARTARSIALTFRYVGAGCGGVLGCARVSAVMLPVCAHSLLRRFIPPFLTTVTYLAACPLNCPASPARCPLDPLLTTFPSCLLLLCLQGGRVSGG